MSHTVELQQVEKKVEQQTLLHSLSLSLDKGEFLAIIGPSGSGKSTLLRLIAGLDQPTSGRILINDCLINQLPPARRDIAMVFQDYALYPHMSVFDNMAYGLKMRGMNKRDIQIRVEEIAQRLGMASFLTKRPHQLSGGQQQRVAMGRAMVRQPSLYLFDEPLSNLDVTLRAQLKAEIKQLHRTFNITSLFVTHDQAEAMTLADRILILNHGRVEQLDTPYQIYHRPQNMFVGQFIGTYPMNLIPAQIDLTHSAVRVASKVVLPMPTFDSPIEDQAKVWIGIRPEDMAVIFEDQILDVLSNDSLSCLKVRETDVDDTGADMLIRMDAEGLTGSLLVRIASKEKHNKQIHSINLKHSRAHVFCAKTQQRMGGWDAQTTTG